jgi:hypothetical protein
MATDYSAENPFPAGSPAHRAWIQMKGDEQGMRFYTDTPRDQLDALPYEQRQALSRAMAPQSRRDNLNPNVQFISPGEANEFGGLGLNANPNYQIIQNIENPWTAAETAFMVRWGISPDLSPTQANRSSIARAMEFETRTEAARAASPAGTAQAAVPEAGIGEPAYAPGYAPTPAPPSPTSFAEFLAQQANPTRRTPDVSLGSSGWMNPNSTLDINRASSSPDYRGTPLLQRPASTPSTGSDWSQALRRLRTFYGSDTFSNYRF